MKLMLGLKFGIILAASSVLLGVFIAPNTHAKGEVYTLSDKMLTVSGGNVKGMTGQDSIQLQEKEPHSYESGELPATDDSGCDSYTGLYMNVSLDTSDKTVKSITISCTDSGWRIDDKYSEDNWTLGSIETDKEDEEDKKKDPPKIEKGKETYTFIDKNGKVIHACNGIFKQFKGLKNKKNCIAFTYNAKLSTNDETIWSTTATARATYECGSQRSVKLQLVRSESDGISGGKLPAKLLSATMAGDKVNQCNIDLAGSDTAGVSLQIADADKVTDFAGGSLDPKDGGGEEDTTSCALDGVGWLICPVANFLGWVTDSLFTTVSTLLNVNSSMFNSGDDTYRAWSAVRNIANVLFVIAFMVVIYSQLTGGVLTNYGIKKMLPRIIVAAILVNVSFWICALAVDISNILGKSLQDLFMNIIPSSNSDGGNNLSVWQDITGWILAGGGAALAVGGVTLAALSSGGFLAAAALALPMLVGVLTAILAAVLVLVARQAIIVILVVISPLAFVAYLLPNTESWFSKWRSTFATMLLLFPIISLIFGGSQLAAAIVRGSTDNALVYISSLGIQAIPLFITPMVLKFSGGLLSRFGGVVNNPNKGPMDRLRRGAEGVRDRTVTRSQNAAMNSTSSSKNPFKNRRPFKKAIQRQARKDAVARAQEQELNRAKTGYIADAAKSDSAFRSQLAAGGGAGADTRALANAINIEANLEADEVKAARAVIEEANLSNSEKAQLAAGGDPITKNGLVLNSAGDAGLQMRLAAQQATVATGDAKQINKMIDYASGKNATDGTDAKELNNMANALESSPNTPSYIQPANLETMRLNGTDSHKLGGADSLIKGALRDGVYSSADKLASTGRQEMGVVSEVAKTMASSPNKQDTDAVLALHEAAKTATTDSRIAPRLGKQKTVVENLASGDTSRW